MWYETALQQLGVEKQLDLEISLVPHAEEPNKALRDLRRTLREFGKEATN